MPNNNYTVQESIDAILQEPVFVELSIIDSLIMKAEQHGTIVDLNGTDYSAFSENAVTALAYYYHGLSTNKRSAFLSINLNYSNSIYWPLFVKAYNKVESDLGTAPPSVVTSPTFSPPSPYLTNYSPSAEVDVMPVSISDSFPTNHYEKIVSKFGSVKPLKVDGLFVTENDLLEQLNKPCTYKTKGIAGCHDLMCRAFVYFSTAHGETQNLLTEEWISAPDSFMDKVNVMATTTTMCPASEQTYCNKCGEFSSKQMKSLLDSAVGWDCWNCYRNHIFRCNICDEIKTVSIGWSAHKIIDGAEIIICKECSVDIKSCSGCERSFLKKPLFNGKCEKCTPNVIKEYQWKPVPPIFHGEGNPNSDPYFGIELEVEMKQGQEHYISLIATRFQQDVGDFIYIKKDSSISSGFEIVTHPGTLSYWQKEADKLFEGLRKLTKHCESWSVDNCGIHVHVGLKSFTEYGHMARFLMFINNNRLFSAFIAERYNAKQAPFLDMSSYDAAMNMVVFNKIYDRHIAVNMQPDLPTIEVRIFKGNMRKAKILKDIEYVHAVQDYTRMQTAYSLMTVKDFIGFVAGKKEQYPNLYNYIAKYKKDI